jgi:hypothetical protein
LRRQKFNLQNDPVGRHAINDENIPDHSCFLSRFAPISC